MKSLITEPLGLYGWKKYEPVLLAALLSEEPLLLVGAHGCAKSFVLERLAESLNMAFRAYNASLINYDDLVGVPLPDTTRTRLEYLSSPESIWNAEVVFIDEISRTRPELQNKLFPIIHEKRVQGRDLPQLVYRWAAMNPPPTDEELDEGDALYLGSEPLDVALADRFPFIISVPDWDDLSAIEQKNVLEDQFAGRHEFPIAIRELIAEARERYAALVPELTPQLSKFVITLIPKLRSSHYDVSTRRATMLLRCAIAIHASREVISQLTGDSSPSLYDSVHLSLLNTLPDRARRKLNAAELTAICKSAWDLSSLDEDDPLVSLMKISDPVNRLQHMVSQQISVTPDRAAVIIGEGIARQKPILRRGLALATFLALREHADIPASTIELLAKEIEPALTTCNITEMVTSNKSKIARAVGACVAEINNRFGSTSEFAQYHSNLLNSYLPDGFSDPNAVNKTSKEFENLWKEFGLS
ncbi:MAG: AAA family ATPase [Proteobacteria bacterium]|nr:AAA family ATPase [Pseudomonadota bacterium]